MNQNLLHPDFWDTYSEVPTAQRKIRERRSLELGNEALRKSWESREKNPAAYLHASFRLRFLGLTEREYMQRTDLTSPQTVRFLENPDMNFLDARYHSGIHRATELWKKTTEESEDNREVLSEGRRRYLNSVVAGERLAVNRLLLQRRIETGPEEFDQLTGTDFQRLQVRVREGRITPFGELAQIIRRLDFPKEKRFRKKKFWQEPEIRAALGAYIADHATYNVPEDLAHLKAACEFLGIDFTVDSIREIGCTVRVARLLARNVLVPKSSLKEVQKLIEEELGTDEAHEIFAEWRGRLNTNASFPSSKRVRAMINDQNIEPRKLMEVFYLGNEHPEPHSVIRNAIERGPNRSMPPAALFHLLSPSRKVLDSSLRRSQEELRAIHQEGFRRASPDIHAALKNWGVGIEDLGYSEDTKVECESLKAGKPSTLTLEEVMRRIEEVGRKKTVLPLQRFVTMEEPTTLAKSLRLLGNRKKGGWLSLAKDGHTSYDTLQEITKGETAVPTILIKDVFAGARVALPAHVEAEANFLYAENLEKKGAKPLGIVLHSLIGQKERGPKVFCRKHMRGVPDRTFLNQLKRAREGGSFEKNTLKNVLKGGRVALKSICGQWAIAVYEEESFATSIRRIALRNIENPAFQQGMLDLLALVETGQPPIASDSVNELFDQRVRLHHWKYGLESKGKVENLSTRSEESALAMLRQLPGVTRKHLLEYSEELAKEKTEEERRRAEEERRKERKRTHSENGKPLTALQLLVRNMQEDAPGFMKENWRKWEEIFMSIAQEYPASQISYVRSRIEQRMKQAEDAHNRLQEDLSPQRNRRKIRYSVVEEPTIAEGLEQAKTEDIDLDELDVLDDREAYQAAE